MNITVDPGEIRVNAVTMYLDLPQVKVFEVDLHSKYAEVLVSQGDDDTTVLLFAGPHTLKTDPEKPGEPTALKVPLGHDWTVLTEVPRYTLRIVLYRSAGEGHDVWVRDDP